MKSSVPVTFKNTKLKKAFETPNEWVGITNKRQVSAKCDSVSLRFGFSKSATPHLAVAIGKTIVELLKWQAGDCVLVQQSNIRPHLMRFVKDNANPQAYKLGENKASANKLYVKFAIGDPAPYEFEMSREVEYDIDNDALIVDLTLLMK